MKPNNNELIRKWESQVRKGTLDFLILLFLRKKEYYGYELIKVVKDTTELEISEGTIYPLLNRLKREELIASRWLDMDAGMPRKYYQITEKGVRALEEMSRSWQQFNSSLRDLMEEVE
jgi:PadR family transcriptional regulator, regulatory protein PadR